MNTSTRNTMTYPLSRSKSAFFHSNTVNQTSTPSSRFNKPHPPLPNVPNTPTSPSTLSFACPTPCACALHDHSYRSAGGAGPPPSSSGTVRSTRSAFFDSKRIKKSKPSIDDEQTYCVLSEEGVEILAKSEEDDFDLTMYSRSDTMSSVKKGSKALKRAPSLSNLLKTPSRLNLRKMPSKVKLFGDTPSSVKSNNLSISGDSSFSHSVHVPPVPQAIPEYHPSANTPTSNKSSRSSKSFLRRAVFRDKTDKLLTRTQPPFHDMSDHPMPGTVASRIKAMEDTYRRSLIVEIEKHANSMEVNEVARSASVPLLNRSVAECTVEQANIGNTPRNKWLEKLHIGKSSTKRKTRLEIPSFEDSPGLSERVEQELRRRSLKETSVSLNEFVTESSTRPTLRVRIEPPSEQEELHRRSFLRPSPLATPTFEGPSAIDRLSLAVSPQFIGANHNHTFTFGSRTSATSYFGETSLTHLGIPRQALIASSPLSGDLHISHSPSRNGSAVVEHLNASFRERENSQDVLDGDLTGRFSIFSYEDKVKVTSERPKSDPIPLKNIAHVTNELRNLLESFEDTFVYDAASINTSTAPGIKHSYFASPAPPSRKVTPRKQEEEIPDDLQDLIDGVVQLNEVLRVKDEGAKMSDRPLSGVSSFEGNATTAQDALRALAENSEVAPVTVDTAMATFEWVPAPTIHVEEERISSEVERRDSFSYSTSSARSSMDGFSDPPVLADISGPRPSFDSGRSSFDEPVEDRSYQSRSKQHKYLSSCSGVSNRSSLRDYLAMERPGLGDRMLQEVDEDVALNPMDNSYLLNANRASFTSTTSAQSNRDSYISTVGHFQTARTTNLPFRFSSASESDGTGSIAHSPTPANGIRRVLNRDSLECDLGDLSRLSLDISAPGHGTPSRRNSMESHPSSPISELGRMANSSTISELPSLSLARNAAALMTTALEAPVKQSTQSSLFSLSSVNSSPCPRPPRRKLLMLTGNRLPRPPPSAPVFATQTLTSQTLEVQHGTAKLRPSMSPQQGRVRRLKDTWEAKLSPDKEQERSFASTSSPRYVRPLPNGLENNGEIARPRPLSSLSLTGAIIPPDTPPPSSPSASEMSFASTSHSSADHNRSGSLQGRLAKLGRRRTRGHKRESSQLSRHSILAEPIQEEVTATLHAEPIHQQSVEQKEDTSSENQQEYSDYTQACEFLDSYLDDVSPVASLPPKSVSPLVIRKTRSQTSLASERSLHLGLDAFQTKSQQFIKPKASKSRFPRPQIAEIQHDSVIIVGQDETHWDDLQAHSQLKWTRFCHEAIMELQKSRAQWPDTDVSLDMFESPLGSSNSSLASSIYASPLIQAFSTPGSGFSPDLTSPAHQSAIVGFLLDSKARYRSEIERYDDSQDVPNTPELSPDRPDMQVLQGHGTSEALPSPKHIKRISYKPSQAKRTSYQPKSLMLVQKHLSMSSPMVLNATSIAAKTEEKSTSVTMASAKTVLQNKVNQSELPKSTKGYKPRVALGPPSHKESAIDSVKKAEPIVKPLTPGKRIRAIVKNRTMHVYADDVVSHVDSTESQLATRQKINSFLPGRKLSQRRNDAFTAARRKLEGVGDAGEQTDRSSGLSSSDEMELHKSGLGKFEARPSSSSLIPVRQKIVGTVLEAGGSVEGEDARLSGLYGIKNRPRPPTRRTAPGLVRSMR